MNKTLNRFGILVVEKDGRVQVSVIPDVDNGLACFRDLQGGALPWRATFVTIDHDNQKCDCEVLDLPRKFSSMEGELAKSPDKVEFNEWRTGKGPVSLEKS